jgi:hypothetical protein
MMGRQTGDQGQLFYLFNLKERIPANHLLRRINPIVTRVLADLRKKLAQRYWPAFDRPRAHDPDADRWLLLRHSLRTAALRGG